MDHLLLLGLRLTRLSLAGVYCCMTARRYYGRPHLSIISSSCMYPKSGIFRTVVLMASRGSEILDVSCDSNAQQRLKGDSSGYIFIIDSYQLPHNSRISPLPKVSDKQISRELGVFSSGNNMTFGLPFFHQKSPYATGHLLSILQPGQGKLPYVDVQASYVGFSINCCLWFC